jgi:hypothetical protein
VAHPALYSAGSGIFSLQFSGWDVKLTSHLKLVPGYEWVELHLLPLYVFTARAGTLAAGQIYRVIKKSLCTWWLQYRKLQVMFKVSPADSRHLLTRRTVLEDRVQYSRPSVSPNSNYVTMVGEWNYLTLSLLMSYIYGAPNKDRNLTSYTYGRDFYLGFCFLNRAFL